METIKNSDMLKKEPEKVLKEFNGFSSVSDFTNVCKSKSNIIAGYKIHQHACLILNFRMGSRILLQLTGLSMYYLLEVHVICMYHIQPTQEL